PPGETRESLAGGPSRSRTSGFGGGPCRRGRHLARIAAVPRTHAWDQCGGALAARVQQLSTQRLELAEVAEAGSAGKDWPLGRHRLEPWKSVPAKTMTSGLPSWGAGMPWL